LPKRKLAVAPTDKLLEQVLRGSADANISFAGLRGLLRRLGFKERIRGSQMPKYEVIIYWSSEDQAFIAEVPELPGCAADGKTYAEALANVEVVIQEWIETAKQLGRPIPAPKGRLVFA
jgi:predicted RNase H-like HicB family nuclease